MRRNSGCWWAWWEMLILEIFMARSNLISREMLNSSSVNLIYLIVWKSHGHVRVSGLLFEILNTSGQSLCPGRVNLSRIELRAANYMMRWQTGGRNKRRDGRERMGLELNTCHSIDTGVYVRLEWLWAVFCFCVCVCVAMLDEDEEDRVDEIALRQLTEMGFPESRAVKALRLNQWVFITCLPLPAAAFTQICIFFCLLMWVTSVEVDSKKCCLRQSAGGAGKGDQGWMCLARSLGHRVARPALFPSRKLTFSSAFKVRFYRGKGKLSPSTPAFQL